MKQIKIAKITTVQGRIQQQILHTKHVCLEISKNKAKYFQHLFYFSSKTHPVGI